MTPQTVPLQPSFLERAAAGLRFIATGDSKVWQGWFGPGAPPTPQQPEAGGRQWDYPTSTNTNWQPRLSETVGFDTLRQIADGYDLLRLVIETRKDQLAKLDWSVRPKDKKSKPDQRCKDIERFMASPDKIHGWHEWNRMFWEEALVPDALTILPRRTKGGKPYSLDIIDGTTIKPVIGYDGRIQTEGVAYQQIIKGLPVADFSVTDLYYRAMNPRANKIYGYSKVEQVITTVNIALRRQLYQLQYYTEGSTPDLIFSTPKEWSAKQIKEFSDWWWSQLAGNTAQRRQGMFVPEGVKPIDTKEQALKDMYDEWLARIICYAFSVSPQALVKEQNRSTAETQQDMAKEEGLLPLMRFQKSVMDRIITDFFGADDLEWAWQQEASIKPLDQAQMDASDVREGILTIDEVRERRGLDPLPEPPEPPAPLPPPPGTVPKPEGQPALPDKNQPAAASTATPPTVAGESEKEKMAKAKALKPIKRDTPSMKKAQKRLQTLCKKWQRAQVGKVAAQVTGAMGKIGKGDPAEDRVNQILQELGFKDSDTLKAGVESVLRGVYAEGGAAALDQISRGDLADELLNQVNELAVTWAESRAAELVTAVEDSTREFIRTEVVAAINEGWSTSDLADALQDAYAFSDGRAETIARTELGKAAVQGTLEGYRQSGVVAEKEWLVAQDEVCPECDPLNGVTAKLDEPFPGGAGDPPLHPNCFLPGTVVSAAGVTKHFKRWFEGEIVRLVIEGQDDITVTPNHPILTRRGWVKASKLQDGEDLIQALDPALVVALIDPQNHHIETCIENVADALVVAGGVTAYRMPSSTVDFHGDGTSGQNVDVIASDWKLVDGTDPATTKEVTGSHLGFALSPDSLASRESNSLTGRLGMAGTTDSVVSCPGPSAPGFGSCAGSLDSIPFSNVSDYQPESLECVPDGGAMASDILGEIDARLSCLVSSVKLKHLVRGEKFAGHVFNLQTKTGWYLAGSIVAHNCRCDVLPVLNQEEG